MSVLQSRGDSNVERRLSWSERPSKAASADTGALTRALYISDRGVGESKYG
jgi:hypothetical protein